jgi:AcrR family transcriptional regulator
MPRTEEENQRIRAEQRAKILDAARKVFARKGRAATMAEVAAEAEVSQGLAYRYFTSKEALFNTLIEQMVQSGPPAVQLILEMPGTPGERLDLMISRVVESRRERPEFHQIFFQMIIDETIPNDLRELVSKQGQTFQEVMRQLIVEGQATGEVAAGDPDQLVAAVMACFLGLWSGMALHDPKEVKKHFPDARIILRMLRPDPN